MAEKEKPELVLEPKIKIKRLTRSVDRLSNLDSAGVAAKSQLEDAQDELEYYNNQRAVTGRVKKRMRACRRRNLPFCRPRAASCRTT